MFRKLSLWIIAVTLIVCSARPIIHSHSNSHQPSRPVGAPQPIAPRAADTFNDPITINDPVATVNIVPQSQPPAVPLPAIETQPDLYGQTNVAALVGEHTGSPLPEQQTTRLPILEYHYSTFKMSAGVRMETDWFLNQLQWLHDNDFQTLTAQQLADFVHGDLNPSPRSVVLTFDVGASKFDDYVDVIIPALRKYNFHAVFFILASRTVDSCETSGKRIGSPLQDVYGQIDVSALTTCWPLIKQWADEGIISVGSHSWSHIDYQTLAPDQIYRDAAHSKALIEEKTGHPVLGICYPFDSVNPAAFDLLDSLGYQFAVGGFTQADRSAHPNADQPFALPRYYPYSGDYYPIIGGTHGQTFEQMMWGAIERQE
jgi:peptidoglycan/xylan/chitin deacetylase (PgdA/CDA1 family)